jgi:hypothetical protein
MTDPLFDKALTVDDRKTLVAAELDKALPGTRQDALQMLLTRIAMQAVQNRDDLRRLAAMPAVASGLREAEAQAARLAALKREEAIQAAPAAAKVPLRTFGLWRKKRVVKGIVEA